MRPLFWRVLTPVAFYAFSLGLFIAVDGLWTGALLGSAMFVIGFVCVVLQNRLAADTRREYLARLNKDWEANPDITAFFAKHPNAIIDDLPRDLRDRLQGGMQ